MRVEDMQDRLHWNGTLRGGYVVVWDGTRSSASGTKYLDAEDHQPTPKAHVPTPVHRTGTLTEIVLDWLESHGPATIREIAEAADIHVFKVNSAIASLRTRGAITIVSERTMTVERFGVRSVAVWGVTV